MRPSNQTCLLETSRSVTVSCGPVMYFPSSFWSSFRQGQAPDIHTRQQKIVELAVRPDSCDGSGSRSAQNLEFQTVAWAEGEWGITRPQQLGIQLISRDQGGGGGGAAGRFRKLGIRPGPFASARAPNNRR